MCYGERVLDWNNFLGEFHLLNLSSSKHRKCLWTLLSLQVKNTGEFSVWSTAEATGSNRKTTGFREWGQKTWIKLLQSFGKKCINLGKFHLTVFNSLVNLKKKLQNFWLHKHKTIRHLFKNLQHSIFYINWYNYHFKNPVKCICKMKWNKIVAQNY